jgi:mannose-6-phosphate isomerase-like protein (cupin superfamily)
MRFSTPVVSLAVAAAFVAGLVASPLIDHAIGDAHAQGAPLTAGIYDLAGMKHDDLPKSGAEMNARGIVLTEHGTVGIQSGNVAKHMHPQTDEIQYIIEGSGAMWLGNERKDFKAGTLIVIPKGVAHGGTLVTSGPVKAIAIKFPVQPKDGTVFLN